MRRCILSRRLQQSVSRVWTIDAAEPCLGPSTTTTTIGAAAVPSAKEPFLPWLGTLRAVVKRDSQCSAVSSQRNQFCRMSSFASGSEAHVGGIVQIELAQTGEGIADCELLRWFVQEGDVVDEFQALCEVQSDKASVHITSRYKGQVTRVNYIPGDIVKVGEVLLEMIVQEGNSSAPAAFSSGSNEALEQSSDVSNERTTSNRTDEAVLAAPAVRNLAKSYGITLANVNGSGKDGRVLKEDVLSFVMAKEELTEEITAIQPVGPSDAKPRQEQFTDPETDIQGALPPDQKVVPKEEPVEDVSVAVKPVVEDLLGKDKIIPVRGFRRVMAKTMTAAAAVPHFYYTEDIHVDALVRLKDSLQNVPMEQGVKLTYLPFLIKSLSLSLQKYPVMNSTVNGEVSEITVKASHNIGVGMATSGGLIVPNIKNVQNLSVLEIAVELSRLTQLAATNQLSTEDLTGGTITVSNIGSIGGVTGFPVLFLPEVAIVAIGRIRKLPRYAADGSLYPASIMGVTWGADHRVIDGATVASFCNQWKVLIEDPGRFLLNLH